MMFIRTIAFTSTALSLFAAGAHADSMGIGGSSPYRPRPPINAAKGEELRFKQRHTIFYPPTDPLFGSQPPAFKPKPQEDTIEINNRKTVLIPPSNDEPKFGNVKSEIASRITEANNPFAASKCGSRSSHLSERHK